MDPDLLSWHEVQGDLLRRLAQVNKSLHSATGDEILTLQGRAQLLDELLNLPQTLVMTRKEAV